MSHSYSTHRDKNIYKLTNLAFSSQNFDDRATESPATLGNEVILRQSVFQVIVYFLQDGTSLIVTSCF